jgi:CheY-like chemotaxis protein
MAYLLEDDVPQTLVGDVTRLRQVLVNLLVNAVKFTENGEVVLSAASRPAGDGRFEIQFAVRDTGIGISPENMGRLFQSFTQVDSSTTRNYGGTGLGLAISRKLVELMGGRIWVESEPGKGSAFHFTIKADAAKDPQDSPPSDSRLSDRKVLIVEGNGALMEMLTRAVRSWGMSGRPAAGGGEALAALRNEDFDLVIMDAVLPDGDGPTLAREIRKAERSPVPIVMLIHIGLNVLREPSVSGWLTKPVKPLQLQKLIASLLSTNRGSEGRSAPERSSQSREARFKNLSILLAEDNPINQKVALSMLKHLGYRAEVAANGVEVLQALRRQPFDIVLMDIQMPEMDGLEATHRIREINGRQPFIIAMTAYALDGDREECLKAGMDEYIRKPIQMEDLQKALERFGEATKALE